MMRIGISVTSAHPNLEGRSAVDAMIDRTRAANQAGLDSLFVGDHHVAPINYIQNTPILGRLLAEWDERPCGALFLLPLWHPVIAAEQIATLANIARGPFIMQCGLGDGEKTFQAMSANVVNRPSMFEQSLSILDALWRGETVSSNGRWNIKDAVVRPVPPESIPVWIGARAPKSLDRVARLDHVWLGDPSLTPEEAESTMGIYRECLDRHQRTASTIALRKDIYIAESDDEAEKVKQQVAGYRRLDPKALIIASAEGAAEQFRHFENLGFTDLIIRNLHPEPNKAIESTERLADVKALLNK